MASKTIHRGNTRTVNRSVGANDTLRVQGGNDTTSAGGTGIVSGTISSAGTIEIQGGQQSPSAQGGTLLVSGTLSSSGTILVGAARNGSGGLLRVTGALALADTDRLTVYGGNAAEGSPAGTFVNEGVLTNAGHIDLTGADAFFSGVSEGGVLVNSGTFTNTGVISIDGGRNTAVFAGDGGHGAALIDSGTLTNTRLIEVFGGDPGGYLGTSATAGTLDVSGVLTNSGTVMFGGGGSSPGEFYPTGPGGLLLVEGTVMNAGMIELQAGLQDDENAGAGAQGTITGILANTGTIQLDGSPPSFSPGVYGAGGTLTLAAGGTLVNSGRVVIDGGWTSDSGNAELQFLAGSNLTNTGYIAVFGGRSTLDPSIGGSGGVLIIDTQNAYLPYRPTNSGTIEVYAGQSSASIGEHGQSLAGAGGTLMLAAGTSLDNGGLIRLEAGSAGRNGGAPGRGAQMVIADGASLVMETGGSLAIATGAGGAATLTLQGTINGADGADVTNKGVLLLQDGSILAGTLVNTGTITGGGDIYGAHVVNNGVVEVTTDLTLTRDIVNASPGRQGTLLVHSGAVLNLTASTLDTGGQSIVLDAGALVSLAAPAAGVAINSAGGTLDIIGGGNGTLAATDTNLAVFLASPTDLTLSRMAFVTAVGSNGADTITALSSGQTLTGGDGTDRLNGAAATGDTFRDTAYGLNTDIISGFAGTDAIDITNIAASARLSYVQTGAAGTLTVTDGHRTTAITLTGTFTAGSFATAADQHGGVLITLHT